MGEALKSFQTRNTKKYKTYNCRWWEEDCVWLMILQTLARPLCICLPRQSTSICLEMLKLLPCVLCRSSDAVLAKAVKHDAHRRRCGFGKGREAQRQCKSDQNDACGEKKIASDRRGCILQSVTFSPTHAFGRRPKRAARCAREPLRTTTAQPTE